MVASFVPNNFPTPPPQQKFSSLQEFQDFIKDSFLNGSGIDEEIFNACVEFHQDVEWTDGMDARTPIHEELGWYFTRFGRQCREPIYAAFFRNEDGTLWQAIVSIWDEEKQRPYCYLAPKGNGDRAFFPPIPPSIRQKISQRYRVKVPLQGSFWLWLQQNTHIARLLTEGGKKALSALSQGYVAISLYGCNCGREWEVGDILVTPDLEPFAQEYSKWLLALDRDTKPTAKQSVASAKGKLAKALKGYGCDVADLTWNPQQGKGLDDFLVNQGVNSFDHIYHAALTKLDSPHRNNVIPHPSVKNQEIDLNVIKSEYIKLLNADASKSEIQSFKIQTRQKYPLLQPSELNKLLETVEHEFYQAENLVNDGEELHKLLEVSAQTISLSDYLPMSLATPLTQYCEWQNIRHGVVLTSLLTSISSLHKVGTELILHKNLDFSVPPTLYSAIVAESGSKKSPIFRATAKSPLNRLREQWHQEHQERLQEYIQELLAWEQENNHLKKGQKPDTPKPTEPTPPPPFYVTDATGEGLKTQAQKAPDKALFLLVDELAGYLGSQDKYFGGRGSDKQDLLSYYDGTGATVLRAGGIKVDVPQIYLSILGTIQPDVIKKIMGNTKDVDGTWARWLFVHQPNIPTTLPDDVPCGVDCTEVVTSYFEKVFDLPTTIYRLSREAFKLYQPFYNRLEQLRVSHSTPGLRAVYAKAEGLVGRLALNLHVLHELAEGHPPSEVIPLARMEQAIALMKFYIGQTKMLHASVDDGESFAPHIQKVIELSKRKQLAGESGWIKASDVQKNTTANKRPSTVEARAWMVQAATLGYGVLKGEGNKVEFMATPVNQPPTSPIDNNRRPIDDNRQTIDDISIAENLDIQAIFKTIDAKIDGIDKIDDSKNRYSPTPDNYPTHSLGVEIGGSIDDGASIRLLQNENSYTASNPAIDELSIQPSIDLSIDESIVSLQDVQPHHQPGVGFGQSIDDGVSIRLLQNENSYTASNPVIDELSIQPSIDLSIVGLQVDEHPHHQSGVGFGGSIDDGLENTPVPPPIKFKVGDGRSPTVGDRVEFQHELKEGWFKGEIVDIKTEKGYFVNLTVSYREFNYKTKKWQIKQYDIGNEKWVRLAI